MNSNKINQLHVYIIGAVLMLLVGVGLYFTLIKPLNEANQALAAQIQGVDSATVKVDTASCNIDQIETAKKALEAAKKRKAGKQAQLDGLLAHKRPPRSSEVEIGKTPEEVLAKTLPRWLLLPRFLVETMESYAQRLARKHGVTVTTKFGVPPPTTNPDQIPRDIIARNLGPMTMEGPFTNVMEWARDWNSAPLLVSVDGLKCQLAGDKGKVSATASLTVYLFPTGNTAAVTGGGAGGAAGGGMGGGMMMGGNGPAGMPMGGATSANRPN